jgi:hypothetical protein
MNQDVMIPFRYSFFSLTKNCQSEERKDAVEN